MNRKMNMALPVAARYIPLTKNVTKVSYESVLHTSNIGCEFNSYWHLHTVCLPLKSYDQEQRKADGSGNWLDVSVLLEMDSGG